MLEPHKVSQDRISECSQNPPAPALNISFIIWMANCPLVINKLSRKKATIILAMTEPGNRVLENFPFVAMLARIRLGTHLL